MRAASVTNAKKEEEAQRRNRYGNHHDNSEYDCHDRSLYNLSGAYGERKELEKGILIRNSYSL